MPDFPDRLSALLLRNNQTLALRLELELDSLTKAGADSVVICCYTLHCVVPALPSRLGERIVSLTEASIRQVKVMQCPSFLLLCSEGARLGRAFEQSAGWHSMDCAVRHLEPSRAQELHSVIYDLKRTSNFDRAARLLSEILKAQSDKVVLLGCTELHALHRKTNCFSGFQVIDPLDEVASHIAFSNRTSGSG
jgi:aspartate/glutamate racemase